MCLITQHVTQREKEVPVYIDREVVVHSSHERKRSEKEREKARAKNENIM